MAGRPEIHIVESVENLKTRLKQQRRVLQYNKVLTLYLFKSKQAITVREVANILGKGEATIHRWLAQYRQGGIENLIKNRQTVGRPKKLSVETVAKIQLELRDIEGFSSYKEIVLWLFLVQGISSSYGTVYKVVKEELKSKLKVPRPRNPEQKLTAINDFKKSLANQLKNLKSKAERTIGKYSKISFWCSDETRLGLHTIARRKITLSGVKPEGKQQYKFDCFWLYGAVEPQGVRSFFLNFHT